MFFIDGLISFKIFGVSFFIYIIDYLFRTNKSAFVYFPNPTLQFLCRDYLLGTDSINNGSYERKITHIGPIIFLKTID
jgi:hypothetical protein